MTIVFFFVFKLYLYSLDYYSSVKEMQEKIHNENNHVYWNSAATQWLFTDCIFLSVHLRWQDFVVSEPLSEYTLSWLVEGRDLIGFLLSLSAGGRVWYWFSCMLATSSSWSESSFLYIHLNIRFFILIKITIEPSNIF